MFYVRLIGEKIEKFEPKNQKVYITISGEKSDIFLFIMAIQFFIKHIAKLMSS